MEAPFLAGGEASAPYFIGRDDELQDLAVTLGTMSAHRLVLGQRRVGKSSLLLNTVEAIRRDHDVLAAKFSCRTIGSLRALADALVEATLRAYQDDALLGGWSRLMAHLAKKRVSKALEAVDAVQLGAAQELFHARVEFHERALDEQRYLHKALAFLDDFTGPGRRLVLAIDEFQELAYLATDAYQAFKTACDELQHVRFLFSGSSHDLLDQAFLRPDSPLYMVAGRLDLRPLAEAEVTRFVQDRFQVAGLECSPDGAARVHEKTGGVPFYVQKLGLLSWIEALRVQATRITVEAIDAAFQIMMRELGSEFETRLEHKYGPLQKEILLAVATGHHRRKDIADAIGRKEGQLSQALNRLLDYQELERPRAGHYEILDRVFESWLASAAGGT